MGASFLAPISSETESYQRLRRLLDELFQFDQSDLDFGIYRIMNQKRTEISQFLDKDLLPQVRQVFAEYRAGDEEQKSQRTREIEQEAARFNAKPEQNVEYRQLKEELAQSRGAEVLVNEVYSDLYTFFRRYYHEGDFLSLRRYKAGVYAIPYEGEEIKLHWANADQYYVKTTEAFQDYRFRLSDGRHVHFRLVAAETERDNNKAGDDQERRFVLRAGEPVAEIDGELHVYFEYHSNKDKQASLNVQAVETLFDLAEMRSWKEGLASPMPTVSNSSRTLLAKHLADYTAKNSFDYFIHKDLGSFLRRELDFFLKNEVLYIDDLDTDDERRADQYLARLRAIKRIGGKLITFLAQLEDFQKRLFLKKKFVVATEYCLTLDRVPVVLHDQILVNEAQWAEWERLFAVSELPEAGDRAAVLRSDPYLLLDTRFFDANFKQSLLESIEDLDEEIDGLLINAENFQALNLLQSRYRDQVRCVYTDPPYNTASSSIPYKNNYRHSSWASMMYDRLATLHPILKSDGAIFVSIDKAERTVLEHVMDDIFGSENRIEELIWSMNTNNSQAPNYSTNHEYVEVYAKDRRVAERDPTMFREPKPGFEEVIALVNQQNPSYPPVATVESEIRSLYEHHRLEYREQVEAQGLEWDDEKGNDPWKGLFNYSRAEYRDSSGFLVSEVDAQKQQARIWVWRESDASMPATKQAASTRDPNHPNWRFYQPLHPITRKPCQHPKSGWKFAYDDDADSPDRRSFVSLDRDHRIAWGADEKKIPQLKRFLHEVETNIGKSVFTDYSDGEKQTSAMFGRSGVFLAPKHADFVSRFILHAAKQDSVILDCFGGTGSTAHAVIKLNRDDQGSRKYVLIEMGTYFDTVLKPRVLKAVYSKDWKSGKPVSREGLSHILKYIVLESYEDALNNLRLRERPSAQQQLIKRSLAAREDYLLSYCLDVETDSSGSLLDLERFETPFDYQLTVTQGGESRSVTVDLSETFNYLLGLRVKRERSHEGFQTIEGTDPDENRVLVIWRSLKDPETDNEALERFFMGQGYPDRPADEAFNRVYVNGDCTLLNLRPEGASWKLLLIEEEFGRLMFAGNSEGGL